MCRPPHLPFATKPLLALAMIARAIAAKRANSPGFCGDTCSLRVWRDAGGGEKKKALRRAGRAMCLAWPGTPVFLSWGKRRRIAGKMRQNRARRSNPSSRKYSYRAGRRNQSPRLPRTGPIAKLADLDTAPNNYGPTNGLWTRGPALIPPANIAYATIWPSCLGPCVRPETSI